MAIIKAGTEMSLVLEVDENPTALFVHYRRLGTGTPQGEIYSPARVADLVVPQVEGESLVNQVVDWIDQVSTNQGDLAVRGENTVKGLADFPLELLSSLTQSPMAIDYHIEMGSLMVDISWDKATNDVTIYAGDAFTVSYAGFIYYVDTLVDMIRAIEEASDD